MTMTRTWPTGSARRMRSARESGTSSAVSEIAARPTGMLAQKMPRQPTEPTRMPPSTGPSAIDRPETPSQTPIALARSPGVLNVLVMMPSADGVSIEPPTPCRTRKAISQDKARRQAAQPRAEREQATGRPGRSSGGRSGRPRRRRTGAGWPARSCSPATVHCRPDTAVCRDFPMSGRPTFTMVLSRPTMKSALQQTARTMARCPNRQLPQCRRIVNRSGHYGRYRSSRDRCCIRDPYGHVL